MADARVDAAAELGSDGTWSEVVSKGEIRCLAEANGSMLFSGSTNVRAWDLRTGTNTHSIPMKSRTSVKNMVAQRTGEGRTSVWGAHSEGRSSERVGDAATMEPRPERAFGAPRPDVSANRAKSSQF